MLGSKAAGNSICEPHPLCRLEVPGAMDLVANQARYPPCPRFPGQARGLVLGGSLDRLRFAGSGDPSGVSGQGRCRGTGPIDPVDLHTPSGVRDHRPDDPGSQLHAPLSYAETHYSGGPGLRAIRVTPGSDAGGCVSEGLLVPGYKRFQ